VGLKGLRQGTEYLVENKGGGGNRRWTPRISWKDKETKTITFLTPADEIAKIKVHEFIKVPDAEAKDGFRWANLMCRKDPAWQEESGNKCAACDILGHKAKERQVAVAVELESVGGAKSKQFKVRTRSVDREDGTKVEYPIYGLVYQGYKNFYAWFAAHAEREGELTGFVFDVTRKGNDETTNYPVFTVHNAEVDFGEFEFPTLLELVEEFGSQEAYDRELGDIDPGSATLSQGYNADEQEETTNEPPSRGKTKFEELRESLPGNPQPAGAVERY
jgi:hypothetical protein